MGGSCFRLAVPSARCRNGPVLPNSFEEAIHDYDAVTLTAEKRFANRWGLQSSYRWSRLHGNFEGFFRNDNGQSDPAVYSPTP